jgi:hypothetical protein
LEGEWILETDTGNLYMGDGTTPGGELKFAPSSNVNSASNVGTGGVGPFKQISGGEIQFKNINSGSNKISVTNDTAEDEIDVDVVEGNVDHDALQNFVSDEHVDHSSVNINAGTGLNGGGDITSSRTLNLTDTAVSPGSYGDNNSVVQVTVDQQGRITSASEIDIDHDQLLNFVADEHVDHSSVNINAGSGLSGGGDITADRTLSVNEADVDHDALQNFEVDEHRPLDDGSTTTTNLWSGQKIQDELDEKSDLDLSLNTQSGNYTVQASDAGGKVLMDNSSTATVTLPNGLDTGFQVVISRIGTGIVVIAATGTLNSQGTELDLQYTGCVATHTGGNNWLVEGRLV